MCPPLLLYSIEQLCNSRTQRTRRAAPRIRLVLAPPVSRHAPPRDASGAKEGGHTFPGSVANRHPEMSGFFSKQQLRKIKFQPKGAFFRRFSKAKVLTYLIKDHLDIKKRHLSNLKSWSPWYSCVVSPPLSKAIVRVYRPRLRLAIATHLSLPPTSIASRNPPPPPIPPNSTAPPRFLGRFQFGLIMFSCLSCQ